MKRILKKPNLLNSFRHENRRYFQTHSKFYYEQNIFCAFNLIVMTIIFMTFCGYFWRIGWVIAISLSMLLVFFYYHTKSLITKLRIKIDYSKKAVEYNHLDVITTFFNRSHFYLSDIYIVFNFEGTSDKSGNCLIVEKILPASFRKITNKFYLNGGMGEKQMGPITVVISDPLKLFPFYISFEELEPVQVFPRIEQFPDISISPKKDSYEFGEHELMMRGQSTSFIGVREYVEGDPVKHINWKLSLKSPKLIVNEFEKNINGKLAIFVNTHLGCHSGAGDKSTFEYAKDLALAFASTQISKHNSIAMFTNEKYLGTGSGSKFFNFLEISMPKIELTRDNDRKLFVQKYLPQISHGDCIAYISPFIFEKDIIENMETLIQLKQSSGHQIFVFQIIVFDELASRISDTKMSTLLSIKEALKEQEANILKKLKYSGIQVIDVKISSQESFGKQVMEGLKESLI